MALALASRIFRMGATICARYCASIWKRVRTDSGFPTAAIHLQPSASVRSILWRMRFANPARFSPSCLRRLRHYGPTAALQPWIARVFCSLRSRTIPSVVGSTPQMQSFGGRWRQSRLGNSGRCGWSVVSKDTPSRLSLQFDQSGLDVNCHPVPPLNSTPPSDSATGKACSSGAKADEPKGAHFPGSSLNESLSSKGRPPLRVCQSRSMILVNCSRIPLQRP